MRVGTYACVYVVLVVYVYVSGRALDSASLIILVDPHPTTMPCRWRMPPVRWWFFSRRGGCSGERRPTLSAVDWRGLALLALLGPDCGVGGLWVSGPRARSALGWSACRWSLRACRHGNPGAPTLWLSEVPPSGSPPPFSGWRPRLSLRWFSWGSRALGVSGCLGPGLFHACFMPCGMGLLFPTHTIKHLHGGTLWTQARSHTQVYTQAFTLVVKQVLTDTNCLDLLLLQNLFCNISYVCCSITFNI